MRGDSRHSTVLLKGTTAVGGALTIYSSKKTPLYGDVLSVLIDGSDLSNSADLVLSEGLVDADGTSEILGPSIINNTDIGNAGSMELTPSTVLQDNAGVTRVSGVDSIPTLFALHGGYLKAVIANGGDAKVVRIWVTIKG